jgi:hypothetical protein
MPQQTVLILGGGVGGVVAANALRRRLHRRPVRRARLGWHCSWALRREDGRSVAVTLA